MLGATIIINLLSCHLHNNSKNFVMVFSQVFFLPGLISNATYIQNADKLRLFTSYKLLMTAPITKQIAITDTPMIKYSNANL